MPIIIPELLSDYLPGFGYACDVGASDGLFLSNSKWLEDRGWLVLCVEANPELEKNGRLNRKLWRNVACSDSSGIQEFNIIGQFPYASYSALNPSNQCNPIQSPEQWSAITDSIRKVKVQVKTLNELLDGSGFPRLDFLTIDVEGAEIQVLNGLDLDIWTPSIIVAEAWTLDASQIILDRLSRWNYKLTDQIEYDYIFRK